MGIDVWVLAALVVIVSSATQSLTGFGFIMVAVPFLILIIDARVAVALSLMVAFASSAALLLSIKKDTNWQLLKRLLLAAFVGLPFGLAVFYYIDLVMLKVYASAVIIVLSILSLNNFKLDTTKNLGLWQWVSGSTSGFLSGSVGMSGPPIILFLSSLNTPKDEFRATTIAYFFIIYPTSFVSMALTGAIPLDTFKIALYLIPFSIIGMYIGKWLFKYVSDKAFKKLVLIVLIIVASYSIIVNLF
jgi:uncharacterized membrane protein YfcA